jgi:hypothetical protein
VDVTGRIATVLLIKFAHWKTGGIAPIHVAFIKEGIARVVNGLEDETHAKPPSGKDA